MFRSCRVRHLFGLLPLLSFSLLAGTDIPLSGLLSHFAFDGDLLGRAPGGEESRGSFSRHSMATGGAFERIHANAPCFLPGRNGRGLLLSPGFETAKKVTFRNYLAPVAAEILPGGDSGRGWEPVGEGKLTVRPSGDAPHLSLQGRYWLEMVAPRPGDGMVFSPAVDLLEGQYVFSFHVRTAPSRAAAELSVVVGSESGEELARCAVVPGEEWTRHEAVFTLGRFTRDKSKQEYHRISIRLAAAAPAQQLAFDAFQLEFLGGYSYAGIRSASDWMPGHAYRAADRLSFPGLNSGLTHRRGSVAFWFSPHIRKQHRRTLFEIPRSNRWEPHLQLAFVDDASFALSSRRDGRTLEKRVPRREELQTWCHVVVTWDVDHAVLYLDGREAARLKGVEIPTPLPAFRLGSAGPNASAGAVFDDLIVYDRPVTAGEAAALADLEACLERGIQPDVCIRPGRFLPTIARTPGRQRWECTITNTGADRVRRLLATLTIGPSVLDRVEVGKLGVGESRLIAFRFVPDLVTGVYSFAAVVEAAGHEVAAFRRVVRITRAAVPYENLQVSPWGWNAPRELGFTIGGGRVEDAMVDGLAWGPLKHYVGYPRRVLGEDWVQGMTGSPFRTNFHDSKHMRAQLTREAEAFAEEFRHVPAARSVTLTSEMQWIWQHDYSQPRRDWVKKVFGLDLTAWQDPPKGNVDAFQNPYGRLKPSVAKMNPPADRVLELSDPLYAYHRWFHGTTGPTESLMNQTISDAIHVGRPDVLTVQEPILRRCAVRAFERVSIAQEWYYYENPMAAVMVQERLNAAVRGTRMRPTGMPQFLFKKGRAAPYAAMPTADMFRETAWLCVLQPIRMLTYWNAQPMTSATFSNYYNRCTTKAQLDELFGTPTPTWGEAVRILGENPKVTGKIMPWTPELVQTFGRFHTEEIGPLAGLIPRWRNRPRKVAILRSFSSQIYREVRWPRTSWLENCVVHSGVPFDVLYDEDFERADDVLAQYDLLVVSRAVCLTRPAADAITRFSQGDGMVVVDPQTLVKIPGTVVLEPTKSFEAYEQELAAREKQLEERYGNVGNPQYVEAMGDAEALPSRVPPAFSRLIEEHLEEDARSLTPDTWLNVLGAEGVNYIGVVNDLRTRGPMYGHFGKVREQGVPQSATVLITPELGRFAYDVLAGHEVALESVGDHLWATLLLPAGGARLLMMADRQVGGLTVKARIRWVTWGRQRGRELCIEARLDDRDGKRFPGLVPLMLKLVRPDGTASDFSRAGLLEAGRAEYSFPMARNDLGGVWRIEVREAASGQTVSREVVYSP